MPIYDLIPENGPNYSMQQNMRSFKVTRYTVVCFKCRKHGSADSCCPRCREPMKRVGLGVKIPKKSDDRGWKKLGELYSQSLFGVPSQKRKQEMFNKWVKRKSLTNCFTGKKRRMP